MNYRLKYLGFAGASIFSMKLGYLDDLVKSGWGMAEAEAEFGRNWITQEREGRCLCLIFLQGP
jgi:hypothetical protein